MKEGLDANSFHDWELRFVKSKGFEVMYCKLCNQSFMSAKGYCSKNSHIEYVLTPVIKMELAND